MIWLLSLFACLEECWLFCCSMHFTVVWRWSHRTFGLYHSYVHSKRCETQHIWEKQREITGIGAYLERTNIQAHIQSNIYIPTNSQVQTCKFTNINLISILKMFVKNNKKGERAKRIKCLCSMFVCFFGLLLYALCSGCFLSSWMYSYVRVWSVYSCVWVHNFDTDMWRSI